MSSLGFYLYQNITTSIFGLYQRNWWGLCMAAAFVMKGALHSAGSWTQSRGLLIADIARETRGIDWTFDFDTSTWVLLTDSLLPCTVFHNRSILHISLPPRASGSTPLHSTSLQSCSPTPSPAPRLRPETQDNHCTSKCKVST